MLVAHVLFGLVGPLETGNEGLQPLIAVDFVGGATCGRGYKVTCCLQMGQVRESLTAVLRQEWQKVCPQEMVSGRLKTMKQMAQFISSISILNIIISKN